MPTASNTKGVPFADRVTACKTIKRGTLRDDTEGPAPSRLSNPRTLRRNRRAIAAKLTKLSRKKGAK